METVKQIFAQGFDTPKTFTTKLQKGLSRNRAVKLTNCSDISAYKLNFDAYLNSKYPNDVCLLETSFIPSSTTFLIYFFKLFFLYLPSSPIDILQRSSFIHSSENLYYQILGAFINSPQFFDSRPAQFSIFLYLQLNFCTLVYIHPVQTVVPLDLDP